MNQKSKSVKALLMATIMLCMLGTASASKEGAIIKDVREVNISQDIAAIRFTHNNKTYVVERNQDTNNVIQGGFAKTSRMCPPFCVQPLVPEPGVTPVGEMEMLDFMINELQHDTGVLVDARTAGWHKKGTIPGSVNIPFTVFENGPYHPEVKKAFEMFGAKYMSTDKGGWNTFLETVGVRERGQVWDFSGARKVVLWCNGMWCGQSPRAIRAMIKHGYPADKIYYYRGGMQSWQILGLSVIIP